LLSSSVNFIKPKLKLARRFFIATNHGKSFSGMPPRKTMPSLPVATAASPFSSGGLTLV